MTGAAAARAARAAAFAVALYGCRSAADAERLGDKAYGAGQYREALTIYQQAVKRDPRARLWAKIGAAALRVDDFGGAADAYLRLAGEDPTRADEAAEGLELAARGAERAGNTPALQTAVTGLEVVAPERIASRYTLALVRRAGSEPADLVRLLPAAIAAATDPRTVDSLLGVYATALRETAGCEAAMPVYQAVVRRNTESAALAAAGGIAECRTIQVPPDSIALDTMGVP